RTPRGKGKKDGSLYTTQPIDLLIALFDEYKKRYPNAPEFVEDAIVGCVTPVKEQGFNIAKTAAMAAGYPDTTAGVTLSRYCASGLEAINQASAYVMSGQEDLILAGGLESMSRVPMGSDGGALFTNPEVVMQHKIVPQGISADLIASKFGFSRRDLDAFAAESHKRAAKATQGGYFKNSLISISDVNGKVILDKDEMIRPDSSVETLGNLKPSFQMMGEQGGFDNLALQKYPEVEKINHVHHPGNSSAIVDGAALTLVGSESMGQQLGLKPRAKVRAFAVTGTEPTIMLLGPGLSARKALKKAGMEIGDIDLFEVNEAFAVVPMRFMQEMNVPHDKVNVNGGAIAMGHPLGATGSMLISTLIDELERRDLNTGMATLCVGGGMGIATIIERI
ncbi:MAG: acetyl-CoA C-acetyltransferase, partial [Chitinophagales bacterium]